VTNAVQDFGYIVCRRGLRIAAITMAAAAAAYIYTLAHGADYTATARILVAASPQEAGQAARDEAEILRDPALIRVMLPALKSSLPEAGGASARMVQQFGAWWRRQLISAGLSAPETPDQVFATRLTRALGVMAVPGTDVVTLRFTWSDPGFAAHVLNAVLGEQQSLASANSSAAQEIAVAQSRLNDARAELARIDGQIAALRDAGSGAADPGALEREKDRLANRVSTARAAAEQLRLERDVTTRKLEAADKAFAAGAWVDNPDSASSASGATTIDPVFLDLIDKRQRLLERLQADNPRVRALDQQISDAREHAYQSVKQMLGNRVRTLDERLATLTGQMIQDDAAARGVDDRLVAMEALLSSHAAAAAGLEDAQNHAEEVKRLAESAAREAGGLHVLSQATAPTEPDWPAPILVIAASSLFGLVLGLVSAILAELTRQTFDRPIEVVRLLEIPVLASVPELR
jgi:uncharacterized protein involved in exopolysaccharide biosynthesis